MERKRLLQLYLIWMFFCHDGRLSIVPLLPNAVLFSTFPRPNLNFIRIHVSPYPISHAISFPKKRNNQV
jgi:hypothetical protein